MTSEESAYFNKKIKEIKMIYGDDDDDEGITKQHILPSHVVFEI